MNELQKKELSLLGTAVDICERLGLTYFLVCGSALGAVKYGGFIPWDDDVDLGLPREDYEVLMREAPGMLPEGLFLQNYKTDPAFPHLFAKLRDSNTTFVECALSHLPMNHGVYIDIFPLDGYPSDEREQKRLERTKASCLKKLSCVFRRERGPRALVGYHLRRILGYHRRTAAILDKFTAAISRYPTAGSAIWCNHGNWQGSLEYAKREQYGDGTAATFEGMTVRVPERYDEYLTQKYGDWRAELPPERQIGHHGCTVRDLERPYTYYVKNKN